MCVRGLAGRCARWGVPQEILTDNGKVFTGRFNQPPVEVLFDRICRENGITHRLTQPRSPTTTGKIERFHRSLRAEFRTDRVFKTWLRLQAELDEWVLDYNTIRPHQGIGMAPPAERFGQQPTATVTPIGAAAATARRTAATACGLLGEPVPLESCASTGSRSASVSLLLAGTSTCGSPATSYSSSTATNCCAPRSAPTTVRSARNVPRSRPDRPPTPNQPVKDQPNPARQASTEVRQGHHTDPASQAALSLLVVGLALATG